MARHLASAQLSGMALPPAKRPALPPTAVSWETVRQIALALPGVEDGVSYGTPALKVKGKLLVRLREDPDVLVLRTEPCEREHRMASDPATFFITDHYRDYPWMLVRLSKVSPAALGDLIEQAWRRVAPKKLVARSS